MSLQVDFFVVGAARCGTTSLYNYLIQHPEIYLPKIKELNFFSEVESKDSEDYKIPDRDGQYHTKIINTFQVYEQLFSAARPDQLKGDISPSYMWDEMAAARIHAHNPKAKILISLRNPVRRAFSHYAMNFGIGHEAVKDFRKAFEAPSEGIWGGGNLYKELSMYFDAVGNYLRLFGKENVKVMIFEEWTKDLNSSMKEIFNFLEIDPDKKINHSEVHNEQQQYKNIGVLNFFRSHFIKKGIRFFVPSKRIDRLKSQMFKTDDPELTLAPDLENELMAHFTDDVEKLQNIIDRNLDCWTNQRL